MNDRVLGAAGLAASVAIFVYYTAWTLVAPFVDPSAAWFHALFPARRWAIAGPLALLAAALGFVAVFLFVAGKRR